ncbi:hypothetical protein GCM10023175_62810 [Pseudonocardia xishanensis]|uniref:Peptidase M41 domain-containing protein n=1 Tax=Pseudonocardia xishanensis TaxID=630995 RepID=A0ABP8S218_9PSEU
MARPFAEQTQRAVDQEVARLLREAEATASSLLRDHRAALDRLVAALKEHETIDGAALGPIVGERDGAAVSPS